MKFLKLISLMLVLVSGSLFSQSLKTVSSIEKAKKIAKQNHQPILVEVSAKWCHYCTKFEKKTRSDKEVISQLNKNYIFVEVDFDKEEQEFIKENKIRRLPTFVLISEKGEITAKKNGYMSKKKFLKFLKQK